MENGTEEKTWRTRPSSIAIAVLSFAVLYLAFPNGSETEDASKEPYAIVGNSTETVGTPSWTDAREAAFREVLRSVWTPASSKLEELCFETRRDNPACTFFRKTVLENFGFALSNSWGSLSGDEISEMLKSGLTEIQNADVSGTLSEEP